VEESGRSLFLDIPA